MTRNNYQERMNIGELKVADIYGFTTITGVHIIDEECENFVSFWDNDIVTVAGGINESMFLKDAILQTNLCGECEIEHILFSQDDIDITFSVGG